MISYSVTARNNRLNALTSTIGNSGVLKVYDGDIPANITDSIGDSVLLAQLTCGSPFAENAVNAVLTANSIATETSADASGLATYFRLYTSGGDVVIQGTCGGVGSGADLIFNNANLQAGAAISITSLKITEGNS